MQYLRQHFPPAGQILTDSGGALSHNAGNFFRREAVIIKEDDHRPVRLAERLYRLPDRDFGVCIRGGIGGFGLACALDADGALLPAKIFHRRVVDDGQHPAFELSAILQLVVVAVGFSDRVLQYVACVLVVAQDPVRQRIHTGFAGFYRFAKNLMIRQVPAPLL